jgi:predicted TIM-barrel fold metal-dependent hydrolase
MTDSFSALGLGNNRLVLVDTHTHTSGADHDGPPDKTLACMDACGIEKAFIIGPLLKPQGLELAAEHLDNIRQNNDYVAHFCSHDPDRLLAFAVLNPSPQIADGDKECAVQKMIEEARRCYHELGIRGVKMVPDRWTVEDDHIRPLLEELVRLGMYTLFHSGVFMDERSSSYCRPSYYEGVHRVPGFRGHLAHLGWPWVDEFLATLMMEQDHPEQDPEDPWPLKADFSFGAPPDYRLDAVAKALNTIQPQQLLYGSDSWWPQRAEQYLEQYLYPHLTTFEVAATQSRRFPQSGSEERTMGRLDVFHNNALQHWEKAIRGKVQQPKRSRTIPPTHNTRTAADQPG